MNLTTTINQILDRDDDIIDEISMISLIRLIEGGAAMFAAVNRNHHIVSVGRIARIPFVRYRLRVCVIS